MAVAPDHLIGKFHERYPGSAEPSLYRAPGRVNLIGEHTDYNLGFVMPIAIELACYAAVSPSKQEGMLRIYSDDLSQGYKYAVAGLAHAKPQGRWVDYVVGVAQQLVRHGMEIKGMDLLVRSTVPLGSGLSSSAALLVAAAFALGGGRLDKVELAKLCRRAENEFAGVPSGIMDPFVSVLGKANRAIKLDCRTLEFEEVPLPENVVILAVNSMVKHELGTSAYRQRVSECAEAVSAIKRKHPEVESLRDAALDMLDGDIPDPARKRARHIIGENLRVNGFAAAARKGDLKTMGALFAASHVSMRDDYEISCAELDFLVDTATRLKGVYGARMTGGGFGGCTVNLVSPEAVGEIKAKLVDAYREKFRKVAQIYECRPSPGADQIKV